MDEKELKTSLKTRIFISIIAVLMLGSVVASYALIIANGKNDATGASTEIDEARILELEAEYVAAEEKLKEAAKGDFETFVAFKSEIKAYNEAAANSVGYTTRDLKVGSGRELGEGETDYLAYYVGWCADEKVFDSSFDDSQNPTGFVKIIDAAASAQMIEGWQFGITGMKMNGVREITISSELAWKEGGEEVCGSYKPVKFLVMLKEREGDLINATNALEEASMRLQYAYYGINYDEIKGVE